MVAVGARSEGREFDPRSGVSLTGVDTDCVPVLAGVREKLLYQSIYPAEELKCIKT